MKWVGFAPGKVLLSGEHSVVYGHPAIAASIKQGITVTVSHKSNKNSQTLKHDKSGIIPHASVLLNKTFNQFTFTVNSSLPIGSGLGSSAALAAATLKALSKSQNKSFTAKKLYQLVMECEKRAHGNPSGIDAATVINQVTIQFTKPSQIIPFAVRKSHTFYLINTGTPKETTREMVALVQQKYPQNKPILSEIAHITQQLESKLKTGKAIDTILNNNGKLLEKLGVVSPKTIQLSKNLRDKKLAVKITGAGGISQGSGMLLCYHPQAKYCKKVLQNQSLSTIKVIIGE